ncbi:MAG: hypothetical protein COA53_11290 [Rhodobacteraceae bacterium]|nr:MAG: hypothetical protein COA53_11290 [Paracoccaceae bacterium]
MRFSLILSLFLLSTISTAQANSLIGKSSLSETEAQLTAIPDKTPDDQFALGAVRFLHGIEKTLQLRWQHNMVMRNIDLPVLRLPVPPNARSKPFTPALITDLFRELLTDMDASRVALDAIDGAEVALDLDLKTLWFDINMNGARDTGESILEVGAVTLMDGAIAGSSESVPSMKVRFDTADVAWLTAYTHMISAAGEMVVAFDPTEAIASVMDANVVTRELLGDTPKAFGFDMQFGNWVDQFAMAYGALNQQPDATHTRAAHAHLLSMIAENKVFWAGIETETDNFNEWIPNRNQTAALGFELDPDTGAVWQEILADAEALLNGELLINYWRISPAGGVNVQKLFMDPPPVDIVTWVQGAGLLPYLERGPVITAANLRRFEELTAGNPLLFSFLFN